MGMMKEYLLRATEDLIKSEGKDPNKISNNEFNEYQERIMNDWKKFCD